MAAVFKIDGSTLYQRKQKNYWECAFCSFFLFMLLLLLFLLKYVTAHFFVAFIFICVSSMCSFVQISFSLFYFQHFFCACHLRVENQMNMSETKKMQTMNFGLYEYTQLFHVCSIMFTMQIIFYMPLSRLHFCPCSIIVFLLSV